MDVFLRLGDIVICPTCYPAIPTKGSPTLYCQYIQFGNISFQKNMHFVGFGDQTHFYVKTDTRKSQNDVHGDQSHFLCSSLAATIISDLAYT